MPCGCQKRKRSSDSRTTSGSTDLRTSTMFEVTVNDESTGRKFTSRSAAQAYADGIGGEVITT